MGKIEERIGFVGGGAMAQVGILIRYYDPGQCHSWTWSTQLLKFLRVNVSGNSRRTSGLRNCAACWLDGKRSNWKNPQLVTFWLARPLTHDMLLFVFWPMMWYDIAHVIVRVLLLVICHCPRWESRGVEFAEDNHAVVEACSVCDASWKDACLCWQRLFLANHAFAL